MKLSFIILYLLVSTTITLILPSPGVLEEFYVFLYFTLLALPYIVEKKGGYMLILSPLLVYCLFYFYPITGIYTPFFWGTRPELINFLYPLLISPVYFFIRGNPKNRVSF